MRAWYVHFRDGHVVKVDAVDIQEAVKCAHQIAGGEYTYADIISVIEKVG